MTSLEREIKSLISQYAERVKNCRIKYKSLKEEIKTKRELHPDDFIDYYSSYSRDLARNDAAMLLSMQAESDFESLLDYIDE